MIIPDRKYVIVELNDLKDKSLEKVVLELYDHLLGKKTIDNAKDKIEDVLRKMFKIQYSKDVHIPLDFCINSSIAKVLFNILYADEALYSTLDMMKLTETPENPKGYTRQYICKEVRTGRLKATKKGGSNFFTESEVIRYLITKGISFRKRGQF
jgi:hypothetical protein